MSTDRASSSRLIRSPLSRLGLAIAVVLSVLAIGAPALAPHAPYEQLDPAAGRFLPPLSSRVVLPLREGGWLLADSARVTDSGVVVQRLGRTETLPLERFTGISEDGGVSRQFFPLGTDKYGRDLWSRLLYGARVSLFIGLLAAGLSLTLGIAVGGVAALAGGWIDGLLMRLVDGLLMFPRLFLVLVIAAMFDVDLLAVILVLGGTSWMAASRLVRAEILSLRGRDFVVAARGIGLHPVRIFWRHLLPNALPPVLIDTTLRIGDLILIEAALSFLGFGVQPPIPSWGNMVADGASALTTAWWVAAFPGIAICLAVVAFNLLGDGLRDSLDPHTEEGLPC
ncbi:MAG: ABC transporter permease [Thermoanaerobaculia bacterium]